MNRSIKAVVCLTLLCSFSAFAGKKVSFKKLDLDNDGAISLEEYMSRPKKGKRSDKEHIKKSKSEFEKRDVDENQKLCREEFDLVLFGSKSNIDAYRAKIAQQKADAAATVATNPAEIEAEVARLVKEALEKEAQFRQEQELQKKRASVFVYDTRVKTKKETLIGRLSEKRSNDDLALEVRPGILVVVPATDILETEAITLNDDCNRVARQILGN